MFHTTAWVLWLAAALIPFTLTKNPFYLVIALGALVVDYYVLCRNSALGKSWGALLSLGITLALFSVLYNVLFVNVGVNKLVTLPVFRWTFSEGVVQLGGAITLESLVYGLVSALSLIGLLVAFATFNAVADHYQLLRSAPRFLYQSAIVLSIAITFVPQMVLAQAEIREAQTLRGHRFRAVRDLIPLFVTLLAEGLEHSITLAESMSARGFGGSGAPSKTRTPLLQIAIAVGLFLLLTGVVALKYVPEKTVGGGAIVVGAALLVSALWRVGADVQVSRYRRIRWTRRDVLLAIAAVVILAVWGVGWWSDWLHFIFYPYPRLKMPPFEPLYGAVLVLLAAPALLKKMFPYD